MNQRALLKNNALFACLCPPIIRRGDSRIARPKAIRYCETKKVAFELSGRQPLPVLVEYAIQSAAGEDIIRLPANERHPICRYSPLPIVVIKFCTKSSKRLYPCGFGRFLTGNKLSIFSATVLKCTKKHTISCGICLLTKGALEWYTVSAPPETRDSFVSMMHHNILYKPFT